MRKFKKIFKALKLALLAILLCIIAISPMAILDTLFGDIGFLIGGGIYLILCLTFMFYQDIKE